MRRSNTEARPFMLTERQMRDLRNLAYARQGLLMPHWQRPLYAILGAILPLLLVLYILFGPSGPAWAGPAVSLQGENFQPIGDRASNPLIMRCSNGTAVVDCGGGGAAADQTASNSGSTVAPATNHQHALVFNYAWYGAGNAWVPMKSDSAGVISMADALTEAALGTPSDPEWNGSNTATLIALLKANLTALKAATPAGTNVIGKVGIDQTTNGTTNRVNIGADGLVSIGYFSTSLDTLASPAFTFPRIDIRGNSRTSETGSSDPLVGIAPVVTTASATSLVGKASAGNLYRAQATNLTGNAGFLAVLDATAVPSTAAAITPKDCRPLAANGQVELNFGAGPPDGFTSGIVLVLSTSCTSYVTTTGPSGWIKASVR